MSPTDLLEAPELAEEPIEREFPQPTCEVAPRPKLEFDLQPRQLFRWLT